MGKSSSLGDTKKQAASKSRTAKHGGDRRRSTVLSALKQASVVGAGLKGTPKSRVQMHHRTSPPTPKVAIDLKNVFVVGDLLPRNFDWHSWNLTNHLEKTISDSLAKFPQRPCFVYMSTELLDSNTTVPVAVVIQSACVPTRLVAVASIQSETEELKTFDDINMRWAPTSHPMVYVLKCDYSLNGFHREQLLLHCQSPAAVAAEQPERVDSVSIEFNGMDVVWMREMESMDECVDDFVEDQLPDATDDDKATIKMRLQDELSREANVRRAATGRKKKLYSEMMAHDENMTVQGIQDKLVYKVYPKDARLEPVMVKLGNMDIAQGFVKTAYVNRYLGNSDSVF